MRDNTSRKMLALAAGGILVLAAACGGGGKGSTTEEKGGKGGKSPAAMVPLIYGTTDNFVTADPAGSYDLPGSFLLYNFGQTLLQIPPGESVPKPDAADSCEFTDPTTYTCKLKPGLKFSDGSDLTSEDVKFSMDRMLTINDGVGPRFLFQGRSEAAEAKGGKGMPTPADVTSGVVETLAPDPLTVTYKLKAPDVTWPMKLTHAGATIVPSDKYKMDELQKGEFIGSGVYKIKKYQPSTQIAFEPNPNYKGDKKLANGGVLVQKFKDEAGMKAALEDKKLHVVFRSLTPTLIKDLETNGAAKGVKVVKGAGVAISYVVFNHKDPVWGKKEVRQAFSYLIDRKTIASTVYNDTVIPLYSMVPKGFEGQVDSFKTKYGEMPNLEEAKKLLAKAKVPTPVKVQLWYNPDHYGEASADMYAEIERQVEKGGLFDVELKTVNWDTYNPASKDGSYKVFQLGWFPDYTDIDNYISPFFATGNFIGKGQAYSSKVMDGLIAKELSEADFSKRKGPLEEAQNLSAEDVPTLPLWQDQMIAATREGVTGVEKTFDPAYTFRLWLVDASKAK